MKIKFLKAFNGDSILISFDDEAHQPRNILIDGGIGGTYKIDKNSKGKPEFGELKVVIDNLRVKNEFIDLLIITHIDDDHIGGILKWFDSDPEASDLVKKVWFNSGELISEFFNKPENKELSHFITPTKTPQTSVGQGIEFSKYILEKGIWDRKIILQGDIVSELGLKFTILSPNKPKLEKLLKEWKKTEPDLKTSATDDYSKSLNQHIDSDVFSEDDKFPNGSSISFILTYKNQHFLFLGDSHPSVIVEGLKHFGFTEENQLKAELVKLSHHGSKKNTSVNLLKLLDADDFVISTNGRSHQHPDKQLLARLINKKKDCNIYFNYKERMDLVFSVQDRKDFPNFKTIAIEELNF